mmetsp:Transcript_2216/g.7999  ORF Transcript_2216/g.7999 Transcript_2216/m.7999 type:complete len:240 (+) Transcript_2216:1494-2213(+)
MRAAGPERTSPCRGPRGDPFARAAGASRRDAREMVVQAKVELDVGQRRVSAEGLRNGDAVDDGGLCEGEEVGLVGARGVKYSVVKLQRAVQQRLCVAKLVGRELQQRRARPRPHGARQVVVVRVRHRGDHRRKRRKRREAVREAKVPRRVDDLARYGGAARGAEPLRGAAGGALGGHDELCGVVALIEQPFGVRQLRRRLPVLLLARARGAVLLLRVAEQLVAQRRARGAARLPGAELG